MKMDKKKLMVYLVSTFVLAWILQIIGSVFALKGNGLMFTLVLSVSMFAPFAGTLIAKIPLKGMGFMPKFKGNIKYFIAAWLAPAIFTCYSAAQPRRHRGTGRPRTP